MLSGLVGGIVDGITGHVPGRNTVKITGKLVLIKRNMLDFTDLASTAVDSVSDLLGQNITLQLISSTVSDPNNGNRGVVGSAVAVGSWLPTALTPITPADSVYSVTFDWDEKNGVPGAFIIKNNHMFEFFLKSVVLENVPVKGRLHFDCNSWVYSSTKYRHDRVFFANEPYLPSKIPAPLRPYVEDELRYLRGDGITGAYQEWDRIYAYDYYNDLSTPGKRPILGGSSELPYPRRGKTGRARDVTDPNYETRLPIVAQNYVPRDERFGHLKMSDFLGFAIKSLVQAVVAIPEATINLTPMEFDTFQDVMNLYENGVDLPNFPLLDGLKKAIPLEMVKEIFHSDGGRLLKFPPPLIVQADKDAWKTDEEFARQTLAGVNPIVIRRLHEFPPTSKLDPTKYGNQNSTITASQIQSNLEGFSVDEALASNRLFTLDYHDTYMPHINKINSTSSKIYATRTLLFLKDDGTLKPLAIELSLPHPEGVQFGAVSKVITPASSGVEGSLWMLAKAHAVVNDSGIHELISHWLGTHAVIEPIIIATNRQLSVVHPIHKLLSPHYRDTMTINALARQTLVNAGGVFELTFFHGKYAMEVSSYSYKDWKFTDQALPQDLLKRGVAVEDPSQPNKLRLLIEDYPYAVDGLAIWSAIETWVRDYCNIYYSNDVTVQNDSAIQAWWAEIREVGHGDKKDEPWWPKMNTISDLVNTCTTIIWISSALHAAINFGQYPIAGHLPNRPTITRRLLPQPGTKEYAELEKNPEKAFLRTINGELQGLIGISLFEILSRHASDEVYLGQRASTDWTADHDAVGAFQRFGNTLVGIEKAIIARNLDDNLKNRNGPSKASYTLLYPNTSDTTGAAAGISARGIPNSISI